MQRYFIELAYRGTHYSGFQVQQNAITIQSELERALGICFRQVFQLTGASRTDAGVHALQNFFHFDTDCRSVGDAGRIYNINSILPQDIVVQRIFPVKNDAHCRFDAIKREYRYYIYRQKDPFLFDRAYYYPYQIDIAALQAAAGALMAHTDFTSFSKKNSQVNNYICEIFESDWTEDNGRLVYHVAANRFLRGMVKGLVGTMLQVGTGKITFDDFENIIAKRNPALANFAVPSHGLFLEKVHYL